MRFVCRASLLCIIAVVACSDATGPRRTLQLSFCNGVAWALLQNEGAKWQTIATGPATVSVKATDRVMIGRIFHGPPATLELSYLTREQAEAEFVCADGASHLSGSVSGVTGYTTVRVGTRQTDTDASGSFTLTGIAASPQDLVALYGTHAIVRHAMAYADGGAIAPLDFASGEAFTLQTNTLSIPANALALFWSSELITARGTRALFQNHYGSCCADDSLLGFPSAHLQSGDLHHLTVIAPFADGDVRQAEKFYAAASDQQVAFGPAATPATVTMLRTGGDFFRVEVPVQPEYDGQIAVFLSGGNTINSTTFWSIRASSEYRGTAAVWSFTVPDIGVTDLPQGPPDPTSVGSGPKKARWGYERSSHDGDVYLSARTTSTLP